MPKAKINALREIARDTVLKDIVRKIGVDTIAKRKVCSVLLRQRKYTYRQIGSAIGVSNTCVYAYVNPGRINDSDRITQLGTSINGKHVVITGLHKREYTRKCELCDKLPKKRLYYHHWLDDFPGVGMWLCFKCHMLAESVDERSELIDKYVELKNSITIECLTRKEHGD